MLRQTLLVPGLVALRRLQRRPFSTTMLAMVFAGAGAILAWSSVNAALSQEASIRLRLGEVPPAERSVQIRYRTQTGGEAAELDQVVEAGLRAFADVTEGRRRIRVWNPIAPADERGVRLIELDDAAGAVAVVGGRLPNECRQRTCEALTLDPAPLVGESIPLGQGVRARIVGRGVLLPRTLPTGFELPGRAMLIRSSSGPLGPLLANTPSTVQIMAPLRPAAVHGYQLTSLAETLRQVTVRLERASPAVVASAPLPLLDQLARSGQVTRARLLLTAGQGAALIIAFAALAATARRDDVQLLHVQLETLSASRAQLLLARAVEVGMPAVAGGILAIAGAALVTTSLASARGLPSAFVAEALPPQTIVSILGLTAVAAAILFASLRPPTRARFGIGPLEAAGLAGLAAVVWQTVTTGALDPNRIASSPNPDPVLVLVPALAVFATSVLLLRLLPLVYRVSERLARRAPLSLRLALLSTARNPRLASAATTFLSVALGTALFSFNYQTTLDRQVQDTAAFVAGAQWRVAERGDLGGADVSPLTRFTTVSGEDPTPAFRRDATLQQTGEPGAAATLQVLALPAERIPQVLGWRENFADATRAEIVRRLRPQTARITGLALARDATSLRVWAHARTDVPRRIVLHFLLPGQRFQHLELDEVGPTWQPLHIELPATLAGAQLVGIGFPSTATAPGILPFDQGFIELGPVEQQRVTGWSTLPSLEDWVATPNPNVQGALSAHSFEHAPVRDGIRFDLAGTATPFIRPRLDLPATLPALVGPAVAATAVDGIVTLDLLGQHVRVRVVATASLFPTVTDDPSSFAVLDYGTLFAALNVDRPGIAPPSEAWFFRPQASGVAASLGQPPFRLDAAVSLEDLERRLRSDPLAVGTGRILTGSGLCAALLGLLGLALATRAGLRDEEQLSAEYEALGVPPSTLARSAQYRLLVLCLTGLIAALLGAALAVRMVARFVAVTAAAGRPLPPIEPAISWTRGAMLVFAVTMLALLAAATLARRAYRTPPAQRARA